MVDAALAAASTLDTHVPVLVLDLAHAPTWPAHLTPDERARAARFRAEADRSAFTASRTVQRLVGAALVGVPPEDLVVARDCPSCGEQHGPPRWVGSPVHHAVARSREHLVLALAARGPIGVDVESRSREEATWEATRAHLAPEETAHLARLPADDRTAWLWRTWVRKEAVAKATGLGLALDLRAVDVREDLVAAGPGVPTPLHLSSHAVHPGAALALAAPDRTPARVQRFG